MTSGTDLERVVVEGEGVHGRWVVVVAVGTLIVMGCAVAIAWQLALSVGAGAPPARWGGVPDDVQSIELSLLPSAGSGRPSPRLEKAGPARERVEPAAAFDRPRSDARAQTRLGSYGWANRARATVHIPLQRAKELYAQRAAAPPPNSPSSGRAEAGTR